MTQSASIFLNTYINPPEYISNDTEIKKHLSLYEASLSGIILYVKSNTTAQKSKIPKYSSET